MPQQEQPRHPPVRAAKQTPSKPRNANVVKSALPHNSSPSTTALGCIANYCPPYPLGPSTEQYVLLSSRKIQKEISFLHNHPERKYWNKERDMLVQVTKTSSFYTLTEIRE